MGGPPTLHVPAALPPTAFLVPPRSRLHSERSRAHCAFPDPLRSQRYRVPGLCIPGPTEYSAPLHSGPHRVPGHTEPGPTAYQRPHTADMADIIY